MPAWSTKAASSTATCASTTAASPRSAAGSSARGDETVVDANGRRLLPGMIDDQVHFREPGLEYKADMATESAAAVAGGLTSFMDMPNTSPPTLDAAALEDKYRRAPGRAWGNLRLLPGRQQRQPRGASSGWTRAPRRA